MAGINNVPLDKRILNAGSTILRLRTNKELLGKKPFLTYTMSNSNQAAVNNNTELVDVKVNFDLSVITSNQELIRKLVFIDNNKIIFNSNSSNDYLAIYNTSGQEINRWAFQKSQVKEFDISNLLPGLYLAVIENESKKMKTFKILKM